MDPLLLLPLTAPNSLELAPHAIHQRYMKISLHGEGKEDSPTIMGLMIDDIMVELNLIVFAGVCLGLL